MSSEETTQAAILQLRAKAMEAYGIIRDLYNSPSQEGDADKIAAAAFKLAQYEGAMITLQQYVPNLRQSASEAAVMKAAAEAKLQEGATVDVEDPITSADIAPLEEANEESTSTARKVTAENSPTFARAQKRKTRKKKTTAKEKKEDSE
jgi:hypothetical protein